MFFRQYELGCLSLFSYLIGDEATGPALLWAAGSPADGRARPLSHAPPGRLLTLPAGGGLSPAHGAGSACGKNLSTAPQSTIGEQRLTNCPLQPMTEDAFVAAVT